MVIYQSMVSLPGYKSLRKTGFLPLETINSQLFLSYRWCPIVLSSLLYTWTLTGLIMCRSHAECNHSHREFKSAAVLTWAEDISSHAKPLAFTVFLMLLSWYSLILGRRGNIGVPFVTEYSTLRLHTWTSVRFCVNHDALHKDASLMRSESCTNMFIEIWV